MDNLSLIAAFDDLRRCEGVLVDGLAEIEFLKFTQKSDQFRTLWMNSVTENQRLQREFDLALQNTASLETKLYHARRLLESETKCRKDVERQRDALEKKLFEVRDLLLSQPDINEATRDKFAFLSTFNNNNDRRRSKRQTDKYANEVNSTGSFLSDLSVTQSEDDLLDVPTNNGRWRINQNSLNGGDNFPNSGRNSNVACPLKRTRPSHTKRTSISNNKNYTSNKSMEIGANDKIVASTRVSIPQGNGPITAESVIEAVPVTIDEHEQQSQQIINSDKPSSKQQQHQQQRSPFKPSAPPPTPQYKSSQDVPQTPIKHSQCGLIRKHTFANRTFLKSDVCQQCQKKLRFGTIGLKCRECRVCIHIDCREDVNFTCIPLSVGTPTLKGGVGVISDYTPTQSPMVPGLIIHCINEIENRGLDEVGLYRVSGSEKDIKALKERFLRGKVISSLSNVDVHVLCGCIKDFLRNLREPLIPTAMWTDFANAAQTITEQGSLCELYRVVDNLPAANRDTLGLLLQHFLRIASIQEIRMPVTNLAKVFGPTIVGYSSPDPGQLAMFTETTIQANVMEKLLSIPSEYWNQFLNASSAEREYNNNNHLASATPFSSATMATATPSQTNQYFGTLGTPSFRKNTAKKNKFYATPPYSASRKK